MPIKVPCHSQENGYNKDHHIQSPPEKQASWLLSFVINRYHIEINNQKSCMATWHENRRELSRETLGTKGGEGRTGQLGYGGA